MGRARRLGSLVVLGMLPVVATGCYTIFQHPVERDLTATARAGDVGYYPYSPTVWGWYYGHYGDYWSYYAKPWWMHHHHGSGGYYPGEDGFSPLPEGQGFGRGGRDREGAVWPPPGTSVAPPPADPPRHGTVTTTPSGDGDGSGDEKPQKPEEKTNVGGRGGRR